MTLSAKIAPEADSNDIAPLLRVLAHTWLSEVRTEDLVGLRTIPELAAKLKGIDELSADDLIDLAVAYQDLFGFNLPPYESIFVDPSAMLLAPATSRVQMCYAAAGWEPPKSRAAAPDHVGLELLALADAIETGKAVFARALISKHLALWVPPLVAAMRGVGGHPLYIALGELTLEPVLSGLEDGALAPGEDPFPALPPPPRYESHGLFVPGAEGNGELSVGGDPSGAGASGPDAETDDDQASRALRRLTRHLLRPRDAGLYLTKADIVRLGRAVDLPGVMGERRYQLNSLCRLAIQYEIWPDLAEALDSLLAQVDVTYADWCEVWPAWLPYGSAWRGRVAATRGRVAGVGEGQ